MADSSSRARLSESLLDSFWLRMAGMFGHTWASQYGAKPDGVGADTWAAALSGVTGAQLAHGLRETLLLASDFPPSAPRFRALCLGIPSFATVRAEIVKRDSERSPFTLLVWRGIDGFAFARADQQKAERMLREAYDHAREHVMRGGALPEPPVAAITADTAPPPLKLASDETAANALARIAEVLKVGEPEPPVIPSDVPVDLPAIEDELREHYTDRKTAAAGDVE